MKIKVLGESGSVLADEEQDFSGASAGKVLNVTWHPSLMRPSRCDARCGTRTQGRIRNRV